MRRIRLDLQYDGTCYSGWQVQVKETTIQGLLEDAVFTVTGRRERVTGASRTDAGVHALQQVAVFITSSALEPAILMRALNANLPRDVRVTAAEECPAEFHPRYHAANKTYSYLVSPAGAFPVFLKRYSWQVHYSLDCDAMREAAAHLTGKKDFSSFRASGCNSRSPVREIFQISVSESDSIDFAGITLDAPLIKISIKANAFLRHMARIIAGTLVDAGRGRIPPGRVKDIIEARDRRAAGRTAPACGLFLEKIRY